MGNWWTWIGATVRVLVAGALVLAAVNAATMPIERVLVLGLALVYFDLTARLAGIGRQQVESGYRLELWARRIESHLRPPGALGPDAGSALLAGLADPSGADLGAAQQALEHGRRRVHAQFCAHGLLTGLILLALALALLR